MDPASIWYRRPFEFAEGRLLLSLLLLPLSWLYCAVVQIRRRVYRAGWLRCQHLTVPVIVVGNLTVGGTGKTPLTLRLADHLRKLGWTPGIITRGYGGLATTWPQPVHPDSDPALVGDEAVLLARRSGCVVVAGPDRAAAGVLALHLGRCDILLTDDGLQHLRLARDLEIVLVDGERGFGNGRCLPAGPLREPQSRLTQVDLVLYHGGRQTPRMQLMPGAAVNLRQSGLTRPLSAFRGQPVFAVAGIGHPDRFFAQLAAAGLDIIPRPYPDHHRFTPRDVSQWPADPVLMTEKDAVKCTALAADNHWYLPVEAELDATFLRQFDARLTLLARPGHGCLSAGDQIIQDTRA